MVKMFCDKCGNDCHLCAFDITVRVLNNPIPHSVRDTSEPTITQDNTHIRFLLCQDCYERLGFPNIYSVERKGLVFEKE